MMTALVDRHLRSPGRRVGRAAGFLVAVLLLAPTLFSASSVPVARADDLSDALLQQQRLARLIAQQKTQLTQLTERQKTLETEIAAASSDLADVRGSIDELQIEIDDVAAQLRTASAGYATLLWQQMDLRRQQAQLAARAAALQLELDERRHILGDRLASLYETDQTPILQQVLTAHSLTEALSDTSYYSDMAAEDKALADRISKDKAELDTLWQSIAMAAAATESSTAQAAAGKKRLDGQNVQLVAAKAKLAELKKELEAQLAASLAAEDALARNKTLLAATITSNGQALDALGARIDQLIALQRETGKIPSQYSGTLRWPMGGVITQEFGCTGVLSEPRIGNCAHFHQGIDLAAPCYTPVYAAGPGEVVFVGYNPYDAPPRAWLVIIAHSSSMVTWYAHMTARAPGGIYVGAQVAQGQLVGTENTTGRSSGCHLHWAVRVNGVFMDPRLFI
jgi:murein DD-endopeptidase MepM/ murein hydrolase activator NlpD